MVTVLHTNFVFPTSRNPSPLVKDAAVERDAAVGVNVGGDKDGAGVDVGKEGVDVGVTVGGKKVGVGAGKGGVKVGIPW